MPDFQRIDVNAYQCSWREKHLASFYGQSCEWMPRRKYLLFGETVDYTLQATDYALLWRGHVTTRGLVLEAPRETSAVGVTADVGSVLSQVASSSGLQLLGNLLGAGSHAVDTIQEQLQQCMRLEPRSFRAGRKAVTQRDVSGFRCTP